MEAVLEHDNNSTQHGWALRMRDKPTIIGEIEEKRDTLHTLPRSIGKHTTGATQSPTENQKENSQNSMNGFNYPSYNGVCDTEDKRPLAGSNGVNSSENGVKVRIVEVRTRSSYDDGTVPDKGNNSLNEELDTLKERVKRLSKENKSLRKTSRVLVRAVEEAHEAESNLLRKLERQEQSIEILRAVCRSMIKEQSVPDHKLAQLLGSGIAGISHEIFPRSNADNDSVWKLGDVHLKPLYKLGEGAYGKVFAALDVSGYWKSCGQEVAVKFVPRSYTKSFHREKAFLRTFGPIAITPKLLAAAVTKDFNIIVMEKGNATLSSPSNVLLWRGIPKEEDICKAIMKELMGLLLALHDDGYVHLDIKVDNILLDQDCNMLLCDGGLSNTVENMRYQRIRWQGLESSWHIAPEIRSGAMLFHPEAADMYSAGTLLAGLRLGGLPAEKMTKLRMQEIAQEAFPFDTYPEAHGFLKATDSKASTEASVAEGLRYQVKKRPLDAKLEMLEETVRL